MAKKCSTGYKSDEKQYLFQIPENPQLTQNWVGFLREVNHVN